MAIPEDLSVFLADFGIAATSNGDVGMVLLDTPDANVLGERVQTTEYLITFRTLDFSSLAHGVWIDVGGQSFSVKTVSALDDGAFSNATLQKV